MTELLLIITEIDNGDKEMSKNMMLAFGEGGKARVIEDEEVKHGKVN